MRLPPDVMMQSYQQIWHVVNVRDVIRTDASLDIGSILVTRGRASSQSYIISAVRRGCCSCVLVCRLWSRRQPGSQRWFIGIVVAGVTCPACDFVSSVTVHAGFSRWQQMAGRPAIDAVSVVPLSRSRALGVTLGQGVGPDWWTHTKAVYP